jgi:predicted alpha/beta hydrolase
LVNDESDHDPKWEPLGSGPRVSRIDIELPGHGGTILRGWLYGADRAGPAPAIAMAHGFSATKEMVLDRYAEVFEQAGFVVLVYDHRNLGASDGEPRQEINPWAQARDYRRAIDWLSAAASCSCSARVTGVSRRW